MPRCKACGSADRSRESRLLESRRIEKWRKCARARALQLSGPPLRARALPPPGPPPAPPILARRFPTHGRDNLGRPRFAPLFYLYKGNGGLLNWPQRRSASECVRSRARGRVRSNCVSGTGSGKGRGREGARQRGSEGGRSLSPSRQSGQCAHYILQDSFRHIKPCRCRRRCSRRAPTASRRRPPPGRFPSARSAYSAWCVCATQCTHNMRALNSTGCPPSVRALVDLRDRNACAGGVRSREEGESDAEHDIESKPTWRQVRRR